MSRVFSIVQTWGSLAQVLATRAMAMAMIRWSKAILWATKVAA
jgi:hypothetical protein